jgi:hypothetical protein
MSNARILSAIAELRDLARKIAELQAEVARIRDMGAVEDIRALWDERH